jgi:hypothetical protein
MVEQPKRLQIRRYFYLKASFTVVSSACRGIRTVPEETISRRLPVTLCSNGYARRGNAELSLSLEPRTEFVELIVRSIPSRCLLRSNIGSKRNVNPEF